MNKRSLLLTKIIQCNGDLHQLIDLYYNLNDIDTDDEPIVLDMPDIYNAISLFLTKKISHWELNKWAEVLEGNEQIDYAKTNTNEIADILFYLSSPEINNFDEEHCRQIIKKKYKIGQCH